MVPINDSHDVRQSCNPESVNSLIPKFSHRTFSRTSQLSQFKPTGCVAVCLVIVESFCDKGSRISVVPVAYWLGDGFSWAYMLQFTSLKCELYSPAEGIWNWVCLQSSDLARLKSLLQSEISLPQTRDNCLLRIIKVVACTFTWVLIAFFTQLLQQYPELRQTRFIVHFVAPKDVLSWYPSSVCSFWTISPGSHI